MTVARVGDIPSMSCNIIDTDTGDQLGRAYVLQVPAVGEGVLLPEPAGKYPGGKYSWDVVEVDHVLDWKGNMVYQNVFLYVRKREKNKVDHNA